jgi:hypothetical protein
VVGALHGAFDMSPRLASMCVSSLLPILFAGATGCFGPTREPMWRFEERATPIGSFPRLAVELGFLDDAFSMSLGFDPEVRNQCAILDASAGAFVAGTAMHIDGVGGHNDWEDCLHPSFSLAALPDVANPRLSVVDPDEVFACELGTALARPPAPTLVPDGPWKFTPGQTITVQWPDGATPAIDVRSYNAPVSATIVKTLGRQQQIKLSTTTGRGVLTFVRPAVDLACTGIQTKLSPRPWRTMIEIAAPSPAR